MSSSGIVENFEFNNNKFENRDGKFFMNGEEISLDKFKDNYMSMLTKDIGSAAAGPAPATARSLSALCALAASPKIF